MSGSGNVMVLTPNGRRYNIKVTPDTTIYQVLEEACKKQGLKPEEYDIKHHNHVLDINALIRFSGLPNNAQLEMAATKKSRKESDVTLCLQLESGERLMDTFQPSDTLWTVVTRLQPKEAESNANPVVIYTRREVCGREALEQTTLRHLGLTGGRAILRFLNRTAEELHKQANVSAPLPHRPSENLKSTPQKQNSSAGTRASTSHQASTSTATTSQKVVSKSVSAKQQPPKTAPGTKTQSAIASESKQASQGERYKSSIKADTHKSKPMEVNAPAKAPSTSKTTSTKPPSAIQSELSNEEVIQLGERNALAFSFEMAQAVPSADLPDDFFELTVDDVRALFRDLKRRREEMEEAPLITSAQKELEESKRILRQMNEYRRTVIRIQFPDRIVLQGTFKPTETVATVQEFVRGYLENPHTDFYLYTTPPKRILPPTETLIEAHCVPNAMVHFGSKATETTANTYLRQDILSKLSSPKAATLVASSIRLLKHTGNKTSPGNATELDTKEENMDTQSNPSTSSETKSAKVPKWFKPV